MPISSRVVSVGGDVYGHPWRGMVEHTDQIVINVTALTANEVDADGWLKPGVPFSKAGALVGAGVAVWGCTIEPIKVATGNTAPELAAASAAFPIAIGTIGQVNRKVIEDNLGRVLTANEIAGFALAGSTVKLLG